MEKFCTRIQFIFLISLSITACAQQNQRAGNSMLANYFRDVQRNTYSLSKDLREISGLAMSNDARLFAHDDEHSIIYQIDYNSGKVLKKFQVGDKKLKEDFEGMAIIGQDFFLVSSSGDLFRFAEGQDGEEVEFSLFKSDLSSKNDVEGLCYDPVRQDLLLACKGDPGKEFKHQKAIYAVSPETMNMIPDPRFLIQKSDVISEDKYSLIRKIGSFFLLPTQRSFSPSGIAYHPLSKSFFILSAKDPVLVEISDSGTILGVIDLDPSVHKQPEGIEFAEDFSLIIVDEGGKGDAQMTVYKLNQLE